MLEYLWRDPLSFGHLQLSNHRKKFFIASIPLACNTFGRITPTAAFEDSHISLPPPKNRLRRARMLRSTNAAGYAVAGWDPHAHAGFGAVRAPAPNGQARPHARVHVRMPTSTHQLQQSFLRRIRLRIAQCALGRAVPRRTAGPMAQIRPGPTSSRPAHAQFCALPQWHVRRHGTIHPIDKSL